MTAAPSRSVLRGIGSLAGGLVLLVVVPVALWRVVGWPLPTALPNIGEVDAAIRLGIDDVVIVKSLATAAWIAWLQITLAVLAEVHAVVRRRPAIHLPVLPGLQTLVARMVASVALMATAINPIAAGAQPLPLAHATSTSETFQAAPELRPTLAPQDRSRDSATVASKSSAPTITVNRHDSYWSIAEDQLGDGLRWSEIQQLNTGRTMTDGHILAQGSDLLRPGWILELPTVEADSAETNGPTADAPQQVAESVTVDAGDNLWAIAESNMADDLGRTPTDDEIRPYWQALVDSNQTNFVDAENPGLLFSGQKLVLPPIEQEAKSSDSTAVEPEAPQPEATETASPTPSVETEVIAPPSSAPASTTSIPATHASTEPSMSAESPDEAAGQSSEVSQEDHDNSKAPCLIGGLASITLAVGIKRALIKRRRRFAVENPGGVSSATAEPEVAIHRQVVASSDEDAVDALHASLSALSSELSRSGSESKPRVIQVDRENIDVFLDKPHPSVVTGWASEAEGSVLTCETASATIAEEKTCVAPLLVTLGQPDDGAQLYLDLEAECLVSLVGDQEQAAGFARSIIAEVALNAAAETVRVIVVGSAFGTAHQDLDRVESADTWDQIQEDVGAWAQQSHEALGAHGWQSPFAGRADDPDEDALVPMLVVADEPPPAELLECVLAHRQASLAVVVTGEVNGAPCIIDCQPEALTITGLGLACVPQDLKEETVGSIVRLLETADEGESEPCPAFDSSHVSESSDAPADSETIFDEQEDEDEPEYEILVRLLGDIAIEGGTELRPKPTAVVAYIALHGSVTIDSLEDACWAAPSKSSRKRLKDVMSECRSALGSHNLPVASDGKYRVGPKVMTDSALFDLRVAKAKRLSGKGRANVLKSALDLVEGRVFSYPSRSGSSFGWIDTKNLVSQWELKVQSVAIECAELHSESGDHDAAIEVALRALEAIPLDAPLTESLMRSYAAKGDRRAAALAFDAHVQALDRMLEIDPEDSTVELAASLAAGSITSQ